MYAWKVHADLGLALCRFDGQLTASVGRRAFIDHVENSSFDPSHRLLWDIRAAEVIADFSSIFGAVQTLAAVFQRLPQDCQAVFLVETGMQYGMARMLEQILDFASPIRARVVTSPAEAARALNLSEPVMTALLDQAAGTAGREGPLQG